MCQPFDPRRRTRQDCVYDGDGGLRAARLFAELEHQVPTNMFTAEGVHSRLAGAEIEDFRWPLAFFDKFYPGNLGALGLDDVGNALVELRKAGIVEPVDEETQSMFTLTPPGEIVADVFLHEVSKVALHITECRPDGALGHETVLLARGVFNLVLFDVDGETGDHQRRLMRRSCWIYFMTNLRAVLHAGVDLRDHDHPELNDSISVGWDRYESPDRCYVRERSRPEGSR